MHVLRYKDGNNLGEMPKRAISNLQPDHLLWPETRKGGIIPTSREKKENESDQSINNYDQSFDGSRNSREIYGSQAPSSSSTTWWGTPTTARTTRLTQMAGVGRMSTYFLSRQVTLRQSVDLIFKFRVQTLARIVHATGSGDRTPHRTHHRRPFSWARDTSSTHMRWLKNELFSQVILSSQVSSQLALCL